MGRRGGRLASPSQLEENSGFLTRLSCLAPPPPPLSLLRPLPTLRLPTAFWPRWLSCCVNHSKLPLISGPLQPVLYLEYSFHDLCHSWLLLVTQGPTHMPLVWRALSICGLPFTLKSVTLLPFPRIVSHYVEISQLFPLSLTFFCHWKLSAMKAGELVFFGHCCISDALTFGKGSVIFDE